MRFVIDPATWLVSRIDDEVVPGTPQYEEKMADVREDINAIMGDMMRPENYKLFRARPDRRGYRGEEKQCT